MEPRPMTPQNQPINRCQASRVGRSAITIFVKPEAKVAIRAALADGGYGTSFQQGLISLLNDLLKQQKRQPIS